ncbi:AAA family ATPase [Rhodopseudomonas sp.]|uniref:AAA family ATPase n=1 Tax=Rhodopseudomonas sp. TaxID=1078 RepID=UPI0025F32B36|nr:AAA family ATPase [Rhodopseudomonas sp.]
MNKHDEFPLDESIYPLGPRPSPTLPNCQPEFENDEPRADYTLVAYEPAAEAQPIHATPYKWKDPAKIARREWLYGHLLIRKFVTATVSPGGVGKSSLIAAEALAAVSGKPLLDVVPVRRLTVWLWNLEDPQEETERKIQAVALHYGLTPSDISDRLFVDSGRDQPLVMATATRNGTTIARPVVDSLVAEIINRGVDILNIDPFVSCHEASENDNTAMDMIAKEWGRVADRGNCAVHLVHHTRKGEQEVNTESARGGKALTDACRVVRAVNRMSKEEAVRAGVENHRLYFRTVNDKANLAPPVDQSDWFRLESVHLGNGPLNGPGDSIGVVTAWKWPDPLSGVTGADFDKAAAAIRAGKWRENSQAKDWVGKAIAEALDLPIETKAGKAKVAAMIKVWLAAGSLVKVEDIDEKRMTKMFVQVADQP